MSGRETRSLPSVALVVLALAVALFVNFRPGPADAKSDFLADFNSEYGTAGTGLDTCSVCHTAIPSRNSYGADWKSNDKSFSAIESLDSDGDGFSNLAEIQALTNPGDANDHPNGGGLNQTPLASADSYTTNQGATLTATAPGVLGNDSDPDGDPLTATLVSGPGHGTLSLNANGSFTYTPAAGYVGADSFTYVANDGQTDSAAAGVSITVLDSGGGGLDLRLIDISAPASLDVSGGPTTAAVRVTTEAHQLNPGENVVLHVQLFKDGSLLDEKDIATRPGSNGQVRVETDFESNVSAADAPKVDWSANFVVAGQVSETKATSTIITGAPPSTTTTTTTTTVPGSSPNGSALFSDNCSSCHGAAGSGGFGGALAGTSLTVSQINSITTNGTTGMPAFSGSLSSAEIQAISEYVRSLAAAPPPTTTTTVPGSRPNGSAIYAANCSGCHGAGGSGGPGGQLAGLSVGEVASITSNGTAGMPAFGSSLTSDEIDAVASYVAGFTTGTTAPTLAPGATPDATALFGRLCVGCHGTAGVGGSGGPLDSTTLSGAQLLAIIRDGSGAMPAYGSQLDSREIAALAAHVETLAGRTPTIEIPPPGESVTTPDEATSPLAARTLDLGAELPGTGGATSWGVILIGAMLGAALIGAAVFASMPMTDHQPD